MKTITGTVLGTFTPRPRSGSALLGAAIACACLAFGSSGCGDGAPSANPVAPSAEAPGANGVDHMQAGSVSLDLDVGQAKLSSLGYTILGGSFVKSGSLDVSHSTRISGVIGGIPFGTNYSITLSGSSAGPPLTACSGSAAFDITAAEPVSVPVGVTCKQSVTAPPAGPTAAPIPQLPMVALALAFLGLGLMSSTRARKQT